MAGEWDLTQRLGSSGKGLWSAAGGVSRPHPTGATALVLIRGEGEGASGRGSPGL